jgi:hypothetical protein
MTTIVFFASTMPDEGVVEIIKAKVKGLEESFKEIMATLDATPVGLVAAEDMNATLPNPNAVGWVATLADTTKPASEVIDLTSDDEDDNNDDHSSAIGLSADSGDAKWTKWTVAEIGRLRYALSIYPHYPGGQIWNDVAEVVGTKTKKQCHNYWNAKLKSKNK